jgi:ACT domain-containing protein
MELARTLFANKQLSIPDICTRLGVSRSTLYRYVGVPLRKLAPTDKYRHQAVEIPTS